MSGMVSLAVAAFAMGPIAYRHEAVVSDSAIASEVGAKVMREGGNAIDAAVATAFALAVTYPAAGNIGGGGFMIIRTKDGQTYALDFREVAPSSASRDMYLDRDGKVTMDSVEGYRASGVPGSVAGLGEAHRRFGKRRWRDVVDPAQRFATQGFQLPLPLRREIQMGREHLALDPEAKRIFLPGGAAPEAGSLFRQPDLGATLARIRDRGAKEFYTGETARRLVAGMKANKGTIGAADLASYEPKWREPVRTQYRGFDIVTMPPPSSGGAVLAQMLNMAETFDIRSTHFASSKSIHQRAEIMRRAFADRAEFFGDPDFISVPVTGLIDKSYAAERAKSIDPSRASNSATIKAGTPQLTEGNHTTHFTVADREGNVVSCTTTINLSFGSGVVVPGTGFLMNNEMDDFTAKVGEPNAFGLIQGARNAIEPGKRPLSSMTPTIVLKDGQPVVALGSPGGPTIINTVFQTILNVVDYKLNIDEAVAAPRIHHQWLPDQIVVEGLGISPDTVDALRRLGHNVQVRGRMGSCHAIYFAQAGWKEVGVDSRVSGSGSAGR